MYEALYDAFLAIAASAIPLKTIAFRSVRPRYGKPNLILSPRGSAISGGRYNPPREFGVLYLALDPLTCLEETIRFAQSTPNEAAKRLPRIIVGIEVVLSQVLNLTNLDMLNAIGVAADDLVATGWFDAQQRGEVALTQQMGRAARNCGVEALIVPSAAGPDTQNLVVFSDQLLEGSSLTVIEAEELELPDQPVWLTDLQSK
jgi:RES domain-containing protein